MSFLPTTLRIPDIEFDSPDDTLLALAGLEREVKAALYTTEPATGLWLLEIANRILSSQSDIGIDTRIHVLLVAVQWLYREGQFRDALPIAVGAVALAERADSVSMKRKTLNNLGTVHIGLGDYYQATVCLVRALEIADRIGDRIGKCGVIANLAVARLEAGLLDESIKLNNYVLEMATGDSYMQALVLDAHHNTCLAAILLADLDLAVRHMEAAVRLLPKFDTAVLACDRATMELTFVRVLLERGDVAAAVGRVTVVKQLLSLNLHRSGRIMAELALALCEAAEGDTDMAFRRIAAVEVEIGPTEPLYRDLLDTKERCYRYAGGGRYARYYEERHLADLSEYQRRIANGQISEIKRTLPFRTKAHSRTPSVTYAEHIQPQLESLSILAELREDGAGEHAFRVGRIASLIAVGLGHSGLYAETIELAARLHDIGKLAIPDAILMKRGPLSDAETSIVKRHTIEGCQMLVDVLTSAEAGLPSNDSGILRMACEVALHHHERWDGKGYPRQLAGERIPESARITAVADTFDKLTRIRPYKEPISLKQAIEVIAAGAGSQFDPRICGEFAKAAANLPADSFGFDTSGGQPLAFLSAKRIIERISDVVHRHPLQTAA